MHFSHKKALDGATISFKTGSIHALLGENGAGKSTLAHVISGFVKQTSGIITYDGVIVSDGTQKGTNPKSFPRIFMVHQNPKLAEDFSVWQNALLAAQKDSLIPYKKKTFIRQLEQIRELWNFELDLNKKINSLNDSERFYAALLCRLAGKPDFLILDEPVAVLDAAQRQAFFDSLRKAKENSLGIIYISHNLEETIKLCDRISILRKGICQNTLDNSNYDASEKEILRIMFGTDALSEKHGNSSAQTEAAACGSSDFAVVRLDSTAISTDTEKSKRAVLTVKELETSIKNKKNLCGVSFECCGGEITVIKGEKNGGIALLENILTGINQPKYSGSIELYGKKLERITPSVLRKCGTGIVSSKKYTVSSSPYLTIKELLLPFSHNKGFNHSKKDAEDALQIVKNENIDISIDEPVSNLSGGMLQRLILARELSVKPKLLILADPLYGLDFKTVRYLQNKLVEAAEDGMAILILMTDADDGFTEYDCLYVLKDGKLCKYRKTEKGTAYENKEA